MELTSRPIVSCASFCHNANVPFVRLWKPVVSWDWRRSFYHWKCNMQMDRINSWRSHFSHFVSLCFYSASFFWDFISLHGCFVSMHFLHFSFFLFLSNRFVSPCVLFFRFPSHFLVLVFSLIFLCFFVALCPSTVQFLCVFPSTVCRWIGTFRHCCRAKNFSWT